MAHIYDIGTRAWQPDTAEGWVASEVTDKKIAGEKVTLVFTLESGEVGFICARRLTVTATATTTAIATAMPMLTTLRRPRLSKPPSQPSRMATIRSCLR